MYEMELESCRINTETKKWTGCQLKWSLMEEGVGQ